MDKSLRIYWAGDLFDHKDLAGNLLLTEALAVLPLHAHGQFALPRINVHPQPVAFREH